MLKRIAPSIRKRFARLTFPNGRGIVRRDGVLYLLNLQRENWYDKHILQWGAGEPEQRAFLIETIRRRDCDVILAGAGLNAEIERTPRSLRNSR